MLSFFFVVLVQLTFVVLPSSRGDAVSTCLSFRVYVSRDLVHRHSIN